MGGPPGLPETNTRADLRFPVPPMVVSILKEKTNFLGVGLNLSRSGMFFQTLQPVDVGEVFQIKFTLPKTDTTVTCKSKVAWRESVDSFRKHSTYAGLQFVEIDPGAAQYLAQLAQKHAENNTH